MKKKQLIFAALSAAILAISGCSSTEVSSIEDKNIKRQSMEQEKKMVGKRNLLRNLCKII